MSPGHLNTQSNFALISVFNPSLVSVSAVSCRDCRAGSVGGGSRSYWK